MNSRASLDFSCTRGTHDGDDQRFTLPFHTRMKIEQFRELAIAANKGSAQVWQATSRLG